MYLGMGGTKCNVILDYTEMSVKNRKGAVMNLRDKAISPFAAFGTPPDFMIEKRRLLV